MGGFATRSFSKGTTITGSPVLHSLQRDWNAKAQVWDSFTKSYKAIDATGAEDEYALLVNYCWSHAQSTILLCPYGVGVNYINHANKPNAKIQWAPHGQLSHDDQSFHQSPTELSKSTRVRLALDYVALRDIREGEEISIDYGRAWQEAYRDFLRRSQSGKTATDVDSYNQHGILKTEAEQAASPYPSDIELKCHPNVMKNELPTDASDEMWGQMTNASLIECHVLERQHVPVSDGSTRLLYAIRVWYQGDWRGRGGIPRMFLRWFHKEQPNVFRFPMQLPDSMVSKAWRDA
jgi:hypothetical protein